MEQPIQQQNKAASSITRCLTKQDQNSAAFRPTLQHQDMGKCWSGVEVEEHHQRESLRRINIQRAMMPIKDNAGDYH